MKQITKIGLLLLILGCVGILLKTNGSINIVYIIGIILGTIVFLIE